jgi:tetratricopeptide (TPR) repeat protein
MKHMTRIALPLLLLVTAMVYAPVLGYDFVHYDDPGYVLENPMVQKGISIDGLRWALTSGEQSNWHPLTWYSHMLDAELFGVERPGMHHLMNLLLHLLNTALVFFVFARLFERRGRALLIAALFALHPVHVESVAWISERKDLLSTSFWLASMLVYVRYARGSRRSNYSLCLLLLALGLAAKPMLVTAPFLFLLLDAWPLRRLSRATFVEKLPMFVLALTASFVTYRVQAAWGSVWSPPWSHRIATALTAYPRYCAKFFWPDDLAVLYPSHVGMWTTPQVVAAAAFLIVVSAALLRLRREPGVLVGWLWFLGTLVPVIGLIAVGRQSIADRYTYVPFLGIALAGVWLFESLRRGRGGQRLAWACAIALLLPLTARTALHLPTWKDSPTLFQHALEITEDNEVMHNNLGTWLFAQGRIPEAIMNYRRALAIRGDYDRTRDNLILALDASGQYEEAAEQLEIRIARKPEELEMRAHAGRMLRMSGRPREALEHYEFILQRAPDSAVIWNNRGGAMLDLLRVEEAIQSFGRAIELDAHYTLAHRNLVAALLQAGRGDEALEHLGRVLESDPENVELQQLAARLRGASN